MQLFMFSVIRHHVMTVYGLVSCNTSSLEADGPRLNSLHSCQYVSIIYDVLLIYYDCVKLTCPSGSECKFHEFLHTYVRAQQPGSLRLFVQQNRIRARSP